MYNLSKHNLGYVLENPEWNHHIFLDYLLQRQLVFNLNAYILKRRILNILPPKKKWQLCGILWVLTHATRGDQLVIHKHIKSTPCTPYIYTVLYVDSISIKLEKMEIKKLKRSILLLIFLSS